MILKSIHNLRRTRGGRIPESAAAAVPQGQGLTVPNDMPHDTPYLMAKVKEMDLMPEQSRAGGEWLHGSSLVGMCARREVLASLSPSRRASPGPNDRIVWALGRAAERHVRSQFVSAVNRVGIVGRWTCKHAGEPGHDFHDGFWAEATCSGCNQPLNEYGELTLADTNAKIIGNPDLLYVRGDTGKLRIVEIKSMNVNAFTKLAAPLADHVSQATIYRRLAQLNGWDVDDEVTIFYVCKDYDPKWKPYKEFHVPISDMLENNLDSMWSKAHEVTDWKAMQGGAYTPGLPHRLPLCNSPTAPHARKCDQCAACFAHG